MPTDPLTYQRFIAGTEAMQLLFTVLVRKPAALRAEIRQHKAESGNPLPNGQFLLSDFMFLFSRRADAATLQAIIDVLALPCSDTEDGPWSGEQ